MSIATCINEGTEHTAKVLDAGVLNLRAHEMGGAIKRENPDVVGLSSNSFTILNTLEVARAVKDISQDIPVVVGGPHATLFPRQTVSYENIDYAVVGEGEMAFPKLLDHLEKPSGLQELPGVFGIEEGHVVAGRPPEMITDLDSLPVIDRTLTPYKKYYTLFAQRKPGTLAMTTAGCPYDCTFCYVPLKSTTAPFRFRSAKTMVEEVRSCAELGIKEIFFYDKVFTLQKKRILEFCRLLREEELDITWDIRTRPDLIDRELLHEMKQVGLRRLQMSGESGTQAVLDSTRKGLTLQKIKEGFSMVREAGLVSFGYFILGLPGETKDMMMETIRYSLELDPDYVGFEVFTPLPGSPLWGHLLERGETAVKEAWERFATCPVPGFDAPVCGGTLPPDDLAEILSLAYKSFYLRPRFVQREIARLRNPRVFLLKLGTVARILRSMIEDSLH